MNAFCIFPLDVKKTSLPRFTFLTSRWSQIWASFMLTLTAKVKNTSMQCNNTIVSTFYFSFSFFFFSNSPYLQGECWNIYKYDVLDLLQNDWIVGWENRWNKRAGSWQLLGEKLGDRYSGVHYTVQFLFMFKFFLTKTFTKWEDWWTKLAKYWYLLKLGDSYTWVSVTVLSTFLHVWYFNKNLKIKRPLLI